MTDKPDKSLEEVINQAIINYCEAEDVKMSCGGIIALAIRQWIGERLPKEPNRYMCGLSKVGYNEALMDVLTALGVEDEHTNNP